MKAKPGENSMTRMMTIPFAAAIFSILFALMNVFAQDSARGHFEAAIADACEGNYSLAAAEFDSTLKIDPYFASARINLRVLGDYETGNISREALNLYFMGIASGNRMDMDGKIRQLTEAIQQDSLFAYAYNERGVAYSQMEKYPPAVADYEKVVRLIPDFIEVYYNLGLAYERMEKLPEAIAAYRKFAKLAPAYYPDHVQYVKKMIEELEQQQ